MLQHPTHDTDKRERYRQYRLILVAVAVFIVLWMVWASRAALFPFALGLIIAYLLAPLVTHIQRLIPARGWLAGARRTIAVLIVYAVWIGLLLLFAFTIGAAAVNQTLDLIESLPQFVEDARAQSNAWNDWYEETIPPDVQMQIETNLSEAGAIAAGAARTALFATVGTVQKVIGLVAGLALLPLWLFYVLKDQGRAFDFFYRMWPENIRDDVRAIVAISDRILGAYIRGQIILGVVIGIVTFAALWFFDIPYAAALAVLAGIFELIPILGPWLSFIAAAIVVLATDPGKIWLVAAIFLIIQQVENTLLVPKIQGDSVDMNPALIMVLIVVGGALFGVIGVIVIVPFAAIARDVFVYVHNRLSESARLPELEGRSNISQGESDAVAAETN